ncbi:MAG: vitamin K epoxide reductase family protein [Candidatus Woesearchaeota archaeon]
MDRNSILKSIIIVSVIGLIIAGYALYLHYAPTGETTFCNISDSFNCDIVNKSAYATFIGIPVALIGIGRYVTFMLLSFLDIKNYFGSPMHILILALSIIGMIFTLYLVYVEAFILYTWCVVCIGNSIMMLLVFLLSIAYYKKSASLSG